MKKFLSLILCAVCISSASMLGIDALGEEQILGGTVSSAGRGYAGNAKTGDAEGVSIVNPARIAFDSKVIFNLNFLYEISSAENDGSTYTVNTLSLPSFNFSFPMGNFGALGLSLWQRYSANLNETYENVNSEDETKILYQGSVYELIPSYAVRLPYLRSFSVGASAHVVIGKNEREMTFAPNNSGVDSCDYWATNESNVSDYVEGSWKIKNHLAYYTFALQYRGRLASYFFSFTTPHTLQNELDYNFRFSEIDTLVPTQKTREIRVPALLATGISYRFMKRHNVMLDLQWRAWDKDVENIAGGWNMEKITETQNDFLVSLGYQRDGSNLFYDPFLSRMSFRLGGWMKGWYVKDVYEFGGAIGAGFPLGKKGTTIDLALQGGKRTTGSNADWEETFLGIRLGLMGIGEWGKTGR